MIKFRFYLVHIPGGSRVWEPLNHKYVLVSADLFDSVPEYLKNKDLNFIIDSGGFRIFSKGVSLNPHKILKKEKEFVEELSGLKKAVPVVLDYPLNPFKSTKDEFERVNEKTLKNVELWAREFGNDFFPVVHAGRYPDLASRWARKYLSLGFNRIAVGSSGPLSARDPCSLLKITEAVKAEGAGWVHVFGAGNSTASALFISGVADSADSSSHTRDAKYGMYRDPKTLKLNKIPKNGSIHLTSSPP